MKPARELPYALSQYAGKGYCQIFTKLCGLETVCLKCFDVFSPQILSIQRRGFIKLPEKAKGQPYTGMVKHQETSSYVSNVVSANLLACEVGGAGEVYNIASGESKP